MARGAVVIPVYGKVGMTRQIVKHCLRESERVHVILVDNKGDFTGDVGWDVEVIRPGENLGWLRGTNLGCRVALGGGFPWICSLNNDTRLSPGFFAGIAAALEGNPQALVAPCYDDVVVSQNTYYKGPVEQFRPQPVEAEADLIDGTCYALTARFLLELGPLDARTFGRRGWGAIEDYVIRARRADGKALVTRRSYLQHESGATAKTTMSAYERYAMAEMRRGMAAKYGRNWRELVGDPNGPDTFRTVLGDALRGLEDRLGLSDTWIGRR